MAKNSRFLKKNLKFISIFGYHSVVAALLNPKRKRKKLIVTSESLKSLDKPIRSNADEIKILSKDEFFKLYEKDTHNQGFVLETESLPQITLDNLINKLNKQKNSLLVMLDQVKDPQNIGSIMRSTALFNGSALIISKDNAPNISQSIIKSASGAAEVVDYIRVTNLIRSIDKIKKNGFWVIGLDSKSSKTIDKLNLPNKCLFILGSEQFGLRKLTKKNCDILVSIKINNNNFKIDSLNVANATSIALHEYFKKIN